MKACMYIGNGDYEISWSWSQNMFRHNRSATIRQRRVVDEERARVFCKKWGLTFVVEGRSV